MKVTRQLNQWATIHRGLGNQNRLKILKLLTDRKAMSVGEIADELKISFKNTSRNLRILQSLDLLEFEGRNDRVYYSINRHLDSEIVKVINITIPR